MPTSLSFGSGYLIIFHLHLFVFLLANVCFLEIDASQSHGTTVVMLMQGCLWKTQVILSAKINKTFLPKHLFRRLLSASYPTKLWRQSLDQTAGLAVKT